MERKYRDGINRQLERLRDVVPSVSKHSPGKLSKNTILTSAVDYIAELEAKVDSVQEERNLICQVFGLGDVCNGGL